jgi:hypothetical protein
MEKNYNVRIEDNGAAYLIVVNKGTNNRFVVCSKSSLGEAWKHIEWMYKIETQSFTVGKKQVPVTDWIEGMKKAGYLE